MGDGDQRKIHWLKWDEMMKSKMEGGMRFRELALFNDSLLAKQTWQSLHNKPSLFYKVFKALFFLIVLLWELKILELVPMLGQVF